MTAALILATRFHELDRGNGELYGVAGTAHLNNDDDDVLGDRDTKVTYGKTYKLLALQVATTLRRDFGRNDENSVGRLLKGRRSACLSSTVIALST